jgi:hypothetical protein
MTLPRINERRIGGRLSQEIQRSAGSVISIVPDTADPQTVFRLARPNEPGAFLYFPEFEDVSVPKPRVVPERSIYLAVDRDRSIAENRKKIARGGGWHLIDRFDVWHHQRMKRRGL